MYLRDDAVAQHKQAWSSTSAKICESNLISLIRNSPRPRSAVSTSPIDRIPHRPACSTFKVVRYVICALSHENAQRDATRRVRSELSRSRGASRYSLTPRRASNCLASMRRSGLLLSPCFVRFNPVTKSQTPPRTTIVH